MIEIKVTVATRHFKAAIRYMSVSYCPMAMALKEMAENDTTAEYYQTNNISVGGCTVGLGVDRRVREFEITNWIYEHLNTENQKVVEDYVDNLIKEAKAGKETPTFEVILKELVYE